MDSSRQRSALHALACAFVVLSSFVASPVCAQASPERAPWGLFSARYDTHTSDFIYALYGYGRSFAMVGTLQNPRSGWTELVGALGCTFALGNGSSHSIATGVAHASDGWYAQLYYVPAIPVGPVWLRSTTEWDIPVSATGVTQFAFSPLSLTMRALRLVEAGAALDLAAATGTRTSVAVGPELRVALPAAVIGTDLQRMTNGSASRLRLFFMTQF